MSRQDADIAEFSLVFGVIPEQVRVHQVGSQVEIGHLFPQLFGQGPPRRLQVNRRQRFAGAAGQSRLIAQHLGLQGRRKAASGLAQLAAKKLHHGFRKGGLLVRVNNILFGQAGGDHRQGHVAHHLGSGRDLDDVAEQLVDIGVGPGDLGPAPFYAQGLGLLPEIGVLPARHLVDIDIRGPGANIRLEHRVLLSHLLPVMAELADVVPVQAGAVVAVGQGLHQGAQVRLRSQAAHAVNGGVENIHAGLYGRQHGGAGDAAGVVGVQVYGQAHRVLQRGDQLPGRGRLQQARHVLDA